MCGSFVGLAKAACQLLSAEADNDGNQETDVTSPSTQGSPEVVDIHHAWLV